ncbi:hypothetical protein D3C80_906300 [compost metagenome]
MHVFDLGQRRQRIRLGAGHRPQGVFANDAVTRQVAGAGFAFTPGAQLAQYRQLRARQLPGQLGIAVQLIRVDLAAQLGNQFGTVFEHPGILVIRQLRAQALVQFGQVHGVFGGVADLGFRQRALQPVGAGFTLGQVDAEHLLDQARIAHGEAQVEVAGGQLGVEQWRRQAAGQA